MASKNIGISECEEYIRVKGKIRAKRISETLIGHTFRQVAQKNITSYMSSSVHEIEFS